MALRDILKYVGIPRVIEVHGETEPTEYHDEDVAHSDTREMYPAGTERIVEKHFYFPRKIGRATVKGNQTVRQVCTHRFHSEGTENHNLIGPYEKWDDQEVISNAQL